MRAVVITKPGNYDVLQVQERPDPVCGPGQVRIEVRAAGLNFAEVMARMGMYPDAPDTPCVVGYEVSGTVAEIGEGVQGITVGDRVMAGTHFGGHAEQVVVTADDVVPLPESLSFEEGAAVPVVYATAWAGLLGYGSLQKGERVLIHAAAGGVGIAATQIAKHHGAEVYGTASPSKHDRIREIGVDTAVDYTRSGWEKAMPKFDLIMDAIGGRSFRRSYDMLHAGGRLVAFGASSVISGSKRNYLKAAPEALPMFRGFNLIDQMSSSKAVIGLNMLTLWNAHGSLRPWIDPLQEMLASGVIKPVVSDVVPFDRAADAHRIITERRNIGKVVLVP
jgi:NADPH:quinone reductase-like Zn-dependent oxidoreductase